jgi:drug/metabolite transporter (DMT)-like permease
MQFLRRVEWVLASLLMFLSSVVLYLFVRKCTLLKIPNQFTNLAIFAIPLLAFLILAWAQKERLGLTSYQLMVVAFASVCFSYLGSVLSLKSIAAAPNPGYSLIISKSYVVFTAVASVFIFGSPLTLRSMLSIILIVAFSALIIINKPTKKKITSTNLWLWLSIGTFFCWGMLALASRYLISLGVGTLPRLIYIHAFVSFLLLAEIRVKKAESGKIGASQLLTLLFVGIASAGFAYFMQLGYSLAPNIGYISAVNASSIGAVTMLSAWLFRDELNLRKLIGVLGVTAGMVLLLI